MKIGPVSNMNISQVQHREPAQGAKAVQHESKAQAAQPGGVSSHNGLTGAERAFFAKLFPDASSQINSHPTYSPAGIHSAVEPGQIVNRKV